MGIIDKVGALLPWRRERREQPARAGTLAFRDDLDRWLQRLTEESSGLPAIGELGGLPSVDTRETDDELIVTVQVPGLDRDDLDLRITPVGLVIRGEKREEKEDTRREYRVFETRYGSFVRTIPLPSGLDLDRAEARVARGVLTVRLPKTAGRPGARRVPIKTR